MGIEQPRGSKISNESWGIGDFYDNIRGYISEVGDSLFRPDVCDKPVFRDGARQINDTVSALKGIDLIISQGEGSGLSPIDSDGLISHYYKFAEIYAGAELVVNGDYYSFSGSEVLFDEDADVYPLVSDASEEMYRTSYGRNQRVNELNTLFNFHFSDMLRCIEVAFHDFASEMEECVGLMLAIGGLAKALVSLPVYNETGIMGNAAPTWSYAPHL